MPPDYEKTAEAMIAGAQKAIAATIAPLIKRIEELEARPMPVNGKDGSNGTDGISGRDGVGIAGALIDRGGVLVLTLSDGTTRELGGVVGKDGERGPPGERGEKGESGEPGLPGVRGELGAAGEKGLDGAPGRDGTNGRDGTDGRDGLNLEDFDVVPLEDGRSVELKFERGDIRHTYELQFAVPLDRGVFKDGVTYQPGDGVTWGGSWWIAQKETSAKPDGADSGWRLAVKKGRDGKDAKAA